MNKLIFEFNLIFLITNVYTSTLYCLDIIQDIGRLSTDKVTLKDCERLPTDDYKKRCTVNSDGTGCIEINRVSSECNDEIIFPEEEYDRRRVSSITELTDSDCKNLKTSDSRYKCVATSDNQTCVEVEEACGLKLSFAILCLLLFL